MAWLSAAPWIQQLPGIDLGTDSHRHIVLNWQQKRVRIWRRDSPIMLFEVTPVQFTGNWTEVSMLDIATGVRQGHDSSEHAYSPIILTNTRFRRRPSNSP